MKKILLILLLFVAATAVQAQQFVCHPYDESLAPREHPVDIIKMKLEVSFVPEQKLVIGKVSHTFTPLQKAVDSIFFDAPSIRIKTAKLDGKDIKFTSTAKGVVVYPSPVLTWDKEYTLVFEYEANPKRGIYFIGWDLPETTNNTNPWRTRRQVWTQGQGIDNRHWIPMYDDANDKFITETVITFNSKYKVLSNGNKLAEKDNGNGTKTWHYTMTKPHAGYLLMLGIGEYAVQERKTKRGIPLHFYYYPDLADRAEPVYRHSEEMFAFLEKETGINYPWESYSQIMVQDFIYGAMENTTATIFGDFFNVDERAYLDRNYEGVNCHELTHQWFGDYITHRTFSEIWLHESYATYFPKLMLKESEGIEAYQWAEKAEMDRVLEAGKKDSYPIRHIKGGSARSYPKGSTVIAMLKYVLGEAEFNRTLNHYLKTHAYKNVETNDLYQAIQDVLGKSPDWFFEQWIYKGGEPHYQVKWEDIEFENIDDDALERVTRITVKQIHERNDWTGLFKMPFDIEVYYKDGSHTTQRAWVQNETDVIDIANPKDLDISYVIFDAGNHVLKNITFERSFEELSQQALTAHEPIDRYLALLELDKTPIDKKREQLQKIFSSESFYGMRAEAAKQLANDAQSTEYIKKALTDKDVHVRKAVLNATISIPMDLLTNFEALLKDSSYNVVETALVKLCEQYPDMTERFLEPTKNDIGMNNALRIVWLEKAGTVSTAAKQEHWKQIAAFAGAEYEFRTRINAFDALKRLNYFDELTFKNLLNASVSANGRLAAPAYSALEFFAKQSAYQANIRVYVKNLKATDDETAVIKRLGF